MRNPTTDSMLEDDHVELDSNEEAEDFLGMNEDDDKKDDQQKEDASDDEASDDEEEETDSQDSDNEETDKEEKSLFDKYELGGQYKDEEDFYSKAKENNQYRTQLEQQNAELKRRLLETPERTEAKKEAPAITNEEFFEDPTGSMKKIMSGMDLVTRAESNQRADDAAANALEDGRTERFIANTPDFKEYEETMQEMYRNSPNLDYLPRSEAIALLYKAAKGEKLAGELSRKSAGKADEDKKSRANTSGGRSEDRKGSYTETDIDKMSDTELEKFLDSVEQDE